jgi:anaerobic selenocysteine-containing dehydrogenase
MPYVAENAVLAQQRVLQVPECRQDEEIMIELARRLELPGCEDSLEDILNDRLEPLGVNFRELKERKIIFPPHRYFKYRDKGFSTPSKKLELYCKTLERLGYDPLPSYRPPPESPVGSPDLVGHYPLVLTTGSRRAAFFHSEHRQIRSLRGKSSNPKAEIHSTIAGSHGIADGDWIEVRSPRGNIRMQAMVTDDIMPGVVNIDHGWWFPEKGGPDFGVWESNANLLTSDDPPYDPAFGTYQLRALLCNINKIK